MQCIVSLCEGFASFTAPLYTSIMVQKPRAAGDAIIRAPAALDPTTLPASEPARAGLIAVRDMLAAGWPALLAALSFLISTNLSDELFVDVLAAHQALTNVTGMLALPTPRDAFLTSLSKSAIPSRVVSSLDSYVEPPTPRSAASFSENLGLTGHTQSPGLSERNMACLKVLITSALFLAGSLGENWFDVLEALQNADYVLTSKGQRTVPSTPSKRSSVLGTPQRSISVSGSAPAAPAQPPQQAIRHPLLSDLDVESVQLAIQRLFDASKNLEDAAFKDFVNALCRLSSEMVGMQSQADSSIILESESADDSTMTGSTTSLNSMLTARSERASRRRVSGIHLPRTLVSWHQSSPGSLSLYICSVLETLESTSLAVWQSSTSIGLFIAPQILRGTRSLLICCQSFGIRPPHSRYGFKPHRS